MDSRLFLNKALFAARRAAAAHQLPVVVTVAAALLLVATCAYKASSEDARKAAMEDSVSLGQRGPGATLVAASESKAHLNLTAFRSSHMLAILEQGASIANLKLDEISFTIDDSPGQPYVRYRATFTVLSRYPTIRKFISEILAGSEGVVLDTVSCRREDVNAVDVRCDISAYVAYQEKVGE
jgi:hypothetical protein